MGHSEGAACQHSGVLPVVEMRPGGKSSVRLAEEAHQARPASFGNRLAQEVVLRGCATVPKVEWPVALR